MLIEPSAESTSDSSTPASRNILTSFRNAMGSRTTPFPIMLLRSGRSTPHGTHRTPEQGLVEIEACSGTQFDPQLVPAFVAEYRQRGHQLPPE